MSRTKRLFDGVFLSYCFQALVMIVGLWLTPFLLHQLGQHDYGIWLVGLQSLTYLSLLDLGVVGLLPREVAFLSGKVQNGADPHLVQTLLENNGLVILWQTPVLLAALFASFFVLRAMTPALHGVLLIIFITYGAQFPFRIFYAALEGLQDFAFIGYLQMGAWLTGVAANIALVYAGWGLYGLAIGWSLSQVIVTVGCMWRMYAAYPAFTPKQLRWLRWNELSHYLKAGFWVSVSQITQMLTKGSDIVLLASIQGSSAVVPYSCSIKLTSVLANQPQVILQAAQPGLTQLRATADRSHIAQVIGSLAQAMLMLSGAVACVVLAINGGFVQRWVGSSQYLGFQFTALIVVSMLARHWNTTTVYTLFCFGKERYISMVGLMDGVCFVPLMYFLVNRFGVVGIPLASTASVCLVSLPSNIRLLSKLTGVSWWTQITPVRQWFVPFGITALVAWAASFMIQPSSYLACGVMGIIIVTIYFLLEYTVIAKSLWGLRLREMFQSGLQRAFQLLRRGSSATLAKETQISSEIVLVNASSLGQDPPSMRTRIVAFATQGGGGDDEDRLRVLLSELSPQFFHFNKTRKVASCLALLRVARARDVDLFVMEGTGFAGGLAVLLSHWLFSVPYVFSSGDSVAPFLAARWPAGRLLFRLYEKLLHQHTSGFIGWTPYLSGRAVTLGAAKAATAAGWAPYTFTDTHLQRRRLEIRASLGIPESSIVFGIVGSLAWSDKFKYCYGLEMVRAALLAQAPEIAILIVGDGEGRDRLAEIAGNALGKTVFLPGRVPRDEVPEYLAAMDIGSLPQSVDELGSFRYTTKISEYFAARLPFFTNQIPAAYDLDFGGLWRLPGYSPWDPSFINSLSKLMVAMNVRALAEKRACIPFYLADFDRNRQTARVTAFIRELVLS